MENDIYENKELNVEVKQGSIIKETFGMLKEWKKPTQQIKDEMREGWLSPSDKEREIKWKKVIKNSKI